MAKRSGLGTLLAVGGYDVSGDVGMLGRIGGGPSLLDVTPINKSAFERLGGRLDAAIEFTAFFNDATGAAHEILSTLPRADTGAIYAMGTDIGEPAAATVGKQIDYAGERDEEGNYRLETQVLANNQPLYWGELATPWPREDGATATDGDSLDGGAATATGLVAFLQVFDIDSGSATIAIESSSDDGAGDAFATFTGSTFAAVTAVGQQVISTADDAAVERYLRVSTSGTFTGLSFAVMIARRATLA